MKNRSSGTDRFLKQYRIARLYAEEVTARKEAEKRLAESEARHQRFLETLQEGFGEIDLDLRIVAANRHLEKMFGYGPGRMIGRHFLNDLLFPEDRQRMLEIIKPDLSGARTTLFDQRFRRKDGKPLWAITSGCPIVDEQGALRGAFGMMTDVTARVLAENAMRQSEESYRLAFEYAKVAMIWADVRTGKLLNCNAAAEKLLERPRSEILGRHYMCIHPPDEKRKHQAVFRQLRTNEVIFVKASVLTGSGRKIPVQISSSTTRIGERLVSTGIFLDLTENKRLEEERFRLGILEASLATRSRLGQDLHDSLGQHMTGIALLCKSLALDLAKAERPEGADAARIGLEISAALEEADALTRGLYPLVLERHGLIAALKDLCCQARTLFKITCDFKCASDRWRPDRDQALHLFRICQEHIHNAVRHGKATRVLIRIGEPNRRGLAVTITDNGRSPAPTAAESEGMGRRIMRYRAEAMKASITMTRTAGGRNQLRCVIAAGILRKDKPQSTQRAQRPDEGMAYRQNGFSVEAVGGQR